MYITFTGKLGSGKSTVAKLIEAKYGYQIYSTGTIQRSLAEKLGITTLELNKRMMSDPSYDHVIDDETARISKERKGDDILFDSRLAFHFVDESFKVFAYVSPYEAADRVMGADRGSVEKYQNREDARAQLLERSKVENERFKEVYQLDNLDYDNYNLIIDTTWVTPEVVMEELMRVASIYEKKPSVKLLCFSPKSLYPLLPMTFVDRNKVASCKEALSSGVELAPVTLCYDGTFHYVTEGIEQVVAALELNLPFVTCVMGEERFTEICIKRACDMRSVRLAEYEAVGAFAYKDIPSVYETINEA